MEQIVFLGVTLLLFWLGVITAVMVVSIMRIRRLQQFELAYAPPQHAASPQHALDTREVPMVRMNPPMPIYRHVNPSDHVAIAIKPDEGPTRAASHVQRIIRHLQGEKRRHVG
jgi:hypothetical protein